MYIFKRNRSGYSMIVLVIAIIVILILAGAAISSLQNSRGRTEIRNFIFDLNAMEEKVQSYYVENGSLPTSTSEAINIYDLANKLEEPNTFLSQLSNYDNENYYIIDLSRIKGLSLHETFRGETNLKAENPEDNGYIVNEGSLKVYVEKGVPYTIPGEAVSTTYYTLTSSLVNGQDVYVPQEQEMIVLGNPKSWVNEATLRVVIPDKSIDSFSDWTFRWDNGPKTEEEMESISVYDAVRNFNYGAPLVATSNGIYTIYVKDPNGKVTLRNINVTFIDDVVPTYSFTDSGDRMMIEDKETGIKEIYFKTLAKYKNNTIQAQEEADAGNDEHSKSRNKVDYYLMDGKGNDVIYELHTLIDTYTEEVAKVKLAMNNENDEYERWVLEHPVDGVTILESQAEARLETHNAYVAEYQRQLNELNAKYSYLHDINGSTDDSRLVIYIEDYAGNASVVGDQNFVTTEMIAKSFNISLDKLKSI